MRRRDFFKGLLALPAAGVMAMFPGCSNQGRSGAPIQALTKNTAQPIRVRKPPIFYMWRSVTKTLKVKTSIPKKHTFWSYESVPNTAGVIQGTCLLNTRTQEMVRFWHCRTNFCWGWFVERGYGRSEAEDMEKDDVLLVLGRPGDEAELTIAPDAKVTGYFREYGTLKDWEKDMMKRST